MVPIKRVTELQANLQIARAVARTFDGFVQDVLHMEFAIGRALIGANLEDQRTYIEKNMAEYPMLLNLIWTRADGTILVSQLPGIEGESISNRKYFQEIVGGRDWAVGDLVSGKAVKQPIIPIARAVRDEQGQLLGILVATILPDRLDEVLAFERPKEEGMRLWTARVCWSIATPLSVQRGSNGGAGSGSFRILDALRGKEVAKSPFLLHLREKIGWSLLCRSRPLVGPSRQDELKDIAMALVGSRLLPQAAFLFLVAVAAFGGLCSVQGPL